ncbi:MAG: heparinase II/III-family protein, partial [Curvibacter sp.]
PYRGPNWKCGQEASIRVMHLAMAALILGQTRQATPALRDLIQLHLQRIAPTLSYAIGQDNNHGTSEAAALFIGGSWLSSLGASNGLRWATLGRRWVENRAVQLISEDGCFSQYSLNYHRVMLDTFSMAEVWRRHLGLPAFSARWSSRALAATRWLHAMVDPSSGDVPNVGANDGARLLQLTDSPYRDFRPSLQLAMVLHAGRRAVDEPGVWNHALSWLGLNVPLKVAKPASSCQGNEGGFAVLRKGRAMAMLRYPRFRFRPSQADVLHLDLWKDGDNLLRDAGTYGYNTESQWMDYFAGTTGHNTVQFDGRDQMPRLGRFLWGRWLRTSAIEGLTENTEGVHFSAAYRDAQGARHRRRIHLAAAHLRVEDEVGGFRQRALLRGRLAPGPWTLDGCRLTNGVEILTVQGSMPILRCEITEGWESRHYLEKTPVPVLEVEIGQPGILTTDYRWVA